MDTTIADIEKVDLRRNESGYQGDSYKPANNDRVSEFHSKERNKKLTVE